MTRVENRSMHNSLKARRFLYGALSIAAVVDGSVFEDIVERAIQGNPGAGAIRFMSGVAALFAAAIACASIGRSIGHRKLMRRASPLFLLAALLGGVLAPIPCVATVLAFIA